jgi:hypothetical protein
MNLACRLSAGLAAVLLLGPGCATRQGTFTVLSTKNTEISRVDLKRVNFTRNVEGKDSRFWFLFIPFGSAPTIENASDECLERGSGDFMTSAVIYRTAWTVILFSYGSWMVQGDVGDSLSGGAADIQDRRAP